MPGSVSLGDTLDVLTDLLGGVDWLHDAALPVRYRHPYIIEAVPRSGVRNTLNRTNPKLATASAAKAITFLAKNTSNKTAARREDHDPTVSSLAIC